MEAIGLFYFVVLTLGFLIVAGFCMVYVIMGFRQITLGRSENNEIKKKAGIKTIAVSSIILLILLIIYLKLVII